MAKDILGVVTTAHANGAIVKVIIEAVLLTDEEKTIACLISKEAGADFVKTSTGFASGGATVHDVELMRRVVGPGMGVKAAGGVPGANGTEEHDENASPAESTSVPLLLCPTCDEPFHPHYLRRCEWCGHEFADGVEIPLPEERIQEPFNWRIAYVIYVLTLLAVGFAVYLVLLL